MAERPKPGEVETRALGELSADGKRLRGLIPYGVESNDLGGWREVIEPGALTGAKLDGLVATVDHGGVPIGRFPGTLEIEDRADGLHWSVEPPVSRADLREAVERGDLRSGSWRMRVARDEWRGDVRHVHEIEELRDVAVVTDPAYETAAVELRHNPGNAGGGSTMDDPTANGGGESRSDDGGTQEEQRTAPESTEPPEQRNQEPPPEEQRNREPEHPERRTGSLQVHERRDGSANRSLAEEFRSLGFDGETPATMPFREFEARAVSLAGGTTTEALSPTGAPAVPLGADQRYAWPIFPSSPVDEGVTSVEVLRQKSRTLPAAADVVRDIDATTEKPEVASELELVSEPLRQVAAKESGIPNVYLSQPAIQPIIDTDLRLAVNAGLDKLALDEIAAAPFYDPAGSPTLLVAIRHAITLVQDEGYNPDTLLISPSDSEGLDTLLVTPAATPDEEEYVFGPGKFAPPPWSLNRRICSVAAPVVLDSQAFGRLHPSPVSLRTFEENDGGTNTSLIRMELHALFAAQRLAAAVRIAAA